MANKTTDFGLLRGEYTILAYLRNESTAELMRDTLVRANVNGDYFTADNLRAAFLAMMQLEKLPDEHAAYRILKEHIPQFTDNSTWEPGTIFDLDFANLAEGEHLVADAVDRFARAHIKRTATASLRTLLNEAARLDLETYTERAKCITADMEQSTITLRAAIPICPADLNGIGGDGLGANVTDGSLLHMPGLVEDMVKFSMDNAPSPNRVLSFAGAITMLAHIVGRRYYAKGGTFPNIYVAALAGSGTGKTAPLDLISKVTQALGMTGTTIDGIGSGQGLEDAMVRSPVLLARIDEVANTLRLVNDPRNRQIGEFLEQVVNKAFSSAHSLYTTRTLSASHGRDGGSKTIYNPSFSFFGASVPELFYAALSENNLMGGFLARFLIFEAGDSEEENENVDLVAPIPDALMKKLDRFKRLAKPEYNIPENPYYTKEVDFAADSKDVRGQVKSEAKGLAKAAKGDAMAQSVWNRSAELVTKLALLYAISESADSRQDPEISAEAIKWAWRLVKALQLRMIAMAHEHGASSEFEKKMQKAKRKIAEVYPHGITRSDLMTEIKAKAGEMNEIRDTLCQMDIATVKPLAQSGNHKFAEVYYLSRKEYRKMKEKAK